MNWAISPGRMPRARAAPHDDEGELAGLGQQDADLHSDDTRLAKEQRDPSGDQALDCHETDDR